MGNWVTVFFSPRNKWSYNFQPYKRVTGRSHFVGIASIFFLSPGKLFSPSKTRVYPSQKRKFRAVLKTHKTSVSSEYRIMAGRPTAPLLKHKGFISGLITGNQWLITPEHKALFLGGGTLGEVV